MQAKKVKGLGVDLIDLGRAREFVKRHRDQIYGRLLSPAERENFPKKKLNALRFARIFSAKEAFFKTLGAEWLGLEGFAQMEMTHLGAQRFRIKALKQPWERRGEGEGFFFQNKDYIGAQVILWK